jgi:hypothetical protein
MKNDLQLALIHFSVDQNHKATFPPQVSQMIGVFTVSARTPTADGKKR